MPKKKTPGQEHRPEHRKPAHAGSENLLPPWKAGHSGNPGGRPAGMSLTARLREMLLKEPKKAAAIVSALIEAAISQDPKALKLAFDRHDGLPQPMAPEADSNASPATNPRVDRAIRAALAAMEEPEPAAEPEPTPKKAKPKRAPKKGPGR